MSKSNWIATEVILSDAREFLLHARETVAQELIASVRQDRPTEDPEKEAQEIHDQFLLLRCFDEAVQTVWDLGRVCTTTAHDSAIVEKVPAGFMACAANLSDVIAGEGTNQEIFAAVSELRNRFHGLFAEQIAAIEAETPTVSGGDYDYDYEDAVAAADQALPAGADYAESDAGTEVPNDADPRVGELQHELDELEDQS